VSFEPEVFGKYILLEKLAAGGMAEIYLAKAPGAENVSKFVAIKRILPQFSKNEEFINMFKEEAKIAINLSHSNIVSIFEFGEVKKQFFLAMDYVEGRNLRQILNRMRKEKVYFSLEHILYMINEVARGLDHAHRCVDGTTGRPLNITHRDMSPQNIMVSFEGEVKIIDFGIAKAESKIETTKAGTLKGKFGYMSPEQADGMEVDFRTDIFSLGIVLWELLARERLFIANNEMNTLRKIRECHIPSLVKIDPNTPVELEEIANKALARDRSLRYGSGLEFHRDLNRFLNRHYPDFSSQDFSEFIKKIYSKERAEKREKMIEYSKLQISTQDDKTEVLGSHTQTLTQTNPTSPTEQLQNLVPMHKEKNAQDVDLDIKVDRKEMMRSTLNNKDGAGVAQDRKQNAAVRVESIKSESQVKYPRSGIPVNTNVTTASSRTSSGGGLFRPAILAFLIIGGGAGLFFFKPELAHKIAQKAGIELGERTSEPQTEIAASTEAKPPQHQVLFTSNPPFAEIYIDGKATGQTTPFEMAIPSNKTFKLTLKKQGYLDYSEMLKVVEAKEVKRSLQKASLGYININVRPSSAVLYINGKKLKHKPPLKRYPVSAGAPLRIQAYGTIGKSYGEETVTVKPNNIKNVVIILKGKQKTAAKRIKKPRTPTSNKKKKKTKTRRKRR
jgi:serine/threonine protein kinase